MAERKVKTPFIVHKQGSPKVERENSATVFRSISFTSGSLLLCNGACKSESGWQCRGHRRPGEDARQM